MSNSLFVTASGVRQPQAQDVVVASLNLTGQTASIGTTTLYAVPSSGAGIYRISYSAIDTSAGTSGDTLTVTVGWNNGTAAQSTTTPAVSLSSAGAEIAGDVFLFSAASQNITYATTANSVLGSPQYALRIRVEFLG